MDAHDHHDDEELLLAGGLRLHVRPIGPRDRLRLATFFARLSVESRRRRFLAHKTGLSASELTYLTEIDHVTHEALVAVDDEGAIVGVSRYAPWDGSGDVAELAVVVADELQRRGIGGALAGRIVRRACANGVRRLTAATLWENKPALALLRSLSFRIREYGPVLEFELDLRSVCPPTVAAA